MLRPFILLGARQWHELAFLAIGPIIAAAFVVAGRPVVGPGWVAVLVYTAVGVGGAIGTAGCLLRRIDYGQGLEQGGLLIQAGGLLAWVAWTVYIYGTRGFVLIIFLAMWVLANLARARDIHREVRGLRDASP